MKGRIEGKKGQERRGIGILEEIYDGESYGSIKRRPEDGIVWVRFLLSRRSKLFLFSSIWCR